MHIDNNDLKKFQSDTMNTEDMIAFLEHIDQCDYCLEQLMENEAHNTQSIAPAYMKETIMQRALAPDVQVQKATLETTHKMKLFYEGLQYCSRSSPGIDHAFQSGTGRTFFSTGSSIICPDNSRTPGCKKLLPYFFQQHY